MTIPNSVTSIEYAAFWGCSGLTSIVVENGNTTYDSRNNCNAIIETSTNTLIQGCQNTIIPNNVTSIGQRAFYYCSGLTSVTIPSSVTSIGMYAFYYCSGLTSLTIDNGVNSIEGDAFDGCSSLTSVMIPDSVTNIGTNAFTDCSSLISITIGNGVTILGIPTGSLTDQRIFDFCDNLTTINYTGTKAQWNAIDKGRYWNTTGFGNDKIPATVVHCTDGNVNI